MNWFDGFIILSFIVYSIYSGFKARREASRSLEEYFLAGRSLKGWQAGLSMAATQFAADTPLLVTGLIATAGIFALWQLWIYALAFLLMGFLFAPQWRRARVLTDAEFTEIRYGGRPAAVLRLTKAVYFGTVFNCIVLAWVLFAAAKISEPFLLWDLWLPESLFQHVVNWVTWVGVPVSNLSPAHPDVWVKTASNIISLFAIVGVTTMYSTTGGLRSVVSTDVVQFSIMMIGTFFFSFYVIEKVGGLDALHEQILRVFGTESQSGLRASEIIAFTPWDAKNAGSTILALFALQWIIQLNSDGTGYLAQRAMACRSDRDSKIAGVVFTVAQVLLRSLLWIPLGLGLLVIFPFDSTLSPALQVAAREATYVRGIAELLPPGIQGLMVTAMLAALASTLDTHLNWGSSYWSNDVYKRFICETWLKRKPSQRSLVLVARLSNIVILFVALAVMTQLKSIQEAWQVSLLLGAGIGPVLMLRWLWWRMNAWSEISSIIALVIFAPLLLIYVDDHATRLLAIAAVSVVAATIAAYYKGPEDIQLLSEFYGRVRPAGFWGPIAGREASRDRAVLTDALAATLLAGFSIFCLLVSLGSWIAHSPAPSWFPWPTHWIAILGISGLALIPIWIRMGFKSRDSRPTGNEGTR